MRLSMSKALFWGIAILLATNGAWFIALQTRTFSMPGLVAAQIAPFIAAVISSYFAPKKNVLIGVTMAIPATLLSTFVVIYPQFLGKLIYFAGIKGGLAFAKLTFIFCIIHCLLGGFMGNFIAKRNRNRIKDNCNNI